MQMSLRRVNSNQLFVQFHEIAIGLYYNTSATWSFLSRKVSQCSCISNIPNLRASVRRGLLTALGLIHTWGGSVWLESNSVTTSSLDPNNAVPCEDVTGELPDRCWQASWVRDTVLLLTSWKQIPSCQLLRYIPYTIIGFLYIYKTCKLNCL
jgi:hypothetical protein